MLRVVTAALGALLLAGCGVTGNYRQDPGYAKFDGLTSLAGKPEIGLSFGTLPLALARLAIDDEPEIESILRDLRGVRVYVYDSLEDTERVEREVSAVREGLIDAGWAAIATVRDGDERVAVLLRPDADGEKTHGLTVIVQDSTETIDFGTDVLRTSAPN